MSLRLSDWTGWRTTRRMASLAGVWLLLGAAGCGDLESSGPSVDRATKAISFGPCRDCLPTDASPARGTDPAALPGSALAAQSAPITALQRDWLDVRFGHHSPIARLAPLPPAGDGGGPVGMGPCADCLLVSAKLDDLDLAFDDIDHIDKASLELVTSSDDPWVTEDRPPWGARVVDGRVTDVWVGIPLAAFEDKGVYGVAAVHLSVSLAEQAGRRDVSAPPQETRIVEYDGFFPDL